MKKRHILIFVFAALLAFGAGLGFGILENQNTPRYEAKEAPLEESADPANLTIEPTQTPQATLPEAEGFLLRYVGDRTIAYKIMPGGELEVDFVAGDVRIESLPDQERKRLEEGIRFDTKEKLYSAIENYSS